MKTGSFLLNQSFSWRMDSDGVVLREVEECGEQFPHDVTDVLMLAKTAPQHPPQEPGHQSAVNYVSNVTSGDGCNPWRFLEVFLPPPTASTSIKVDVGICASALFVTAEVAVLD